MPGFNIKSKDWMTKTCDDGPNIPGSVDYGGPSIYIETARVHRYLFEVFTPFGTKADGILLYLTKCTRPTIEIDEIVIHNGQDEIYRPGKNRWQPLELTFYEVLRDNKDAPPDRSMTAEMMFKLWADKAIKLSRSSGFDPQSFCSDAQLDMLNGIGTPIWTYKIYRTWPIKISPSDLSYSSSNISEITATMRFDKAIEEV